MIDSSFNIGLNIKDLLRKKKLTQSEVAEKMGTSSQSLNHILSKDNIQTRSLIKLMNATGIKASEIFEEGDANLLPNPAQNGPGDRLSPLMLEEMNKLKMDLTLYKKDVDHYKSQVKQLEAMVEEKERMIKVLLEKK